MILDSSALVAVVLREPGSTALLTAMRKASPLGIGAPTLAEALVVLTRKLHGDPTGEVLRLLLELEAEVIPFTEEHSLSAERGYRRYGKGRHPAALNYGDTLAYAVAKVADAPLLFIGNDFGKTDITRAL